MEVTSITFPCGERAYVPIDNNLADVYGDGCAAVEPTEHCKFCTIDLPTKAKRNDLVICEGKVLNIEVPDGMLKFSEEEESVVEES
jgi:hypothetical protein